MSAIDTRHRAAVGVLSGAVGVMVAQAVTWALRSETGPVIAVAEGVRDLMPGDLAIRLIHLLGHWDKPLLIIGTLAALLGLCATAGVLSRRWALVPDVFFVVLAGIALLAVHLQSSAKAADTIATIAGLVAWLVSFRILGRTTTVEPGRRTFLIRAGGLVVLAGGGLALARWLGRDRRAVEQARRLLRLPVKSGRAPAGADVGIDGIAPWRTPNEDFYLIHTAITPPEISPKDWRLRIHGMVETELVLTYQDLVGRELVEDWVTLCCVSNPVGGDLIGNAFFSGVRIRDVLALAGVKPGADAVKQTSADGWNCGTPLAALTDDRNAMLALAMNGKPLPVDHGFPVRMVVPGLYGYVSATKWLVDLEVTRFADFDAYWTERGWSELGPVKTQSRIDVPTGDGSVRAGTIGVGGSAWSQHTGIAKVEYQLDGGPWREADLGGVPNLDTWVQWSAQVDVDPGKHRLVVRATDKSGHTQTSVKADVVPNGATGWPSVEFEASG